MRSRSPDVGGSDPAGGPWPFPPGRGLALLGWVLAFALIRSTPAAAEPFRPTDDAQVLERLPFAAADPTAREMRRLRRHATARPDDLGAAALLARRYIELGRTDGDPRYFGYAEAALARFWAEPRPPTESLVLRATIRQARHDFDGALADLEAVLAVDRRNAQAWLTRAVIHQVRGDYAQAMQCCLPLTRLASPLVAATCTAAAASLDGRAREAYALLEQRIAAADEAPAAVWSWALTTLAEIKWRLGHDAAAEEHFRAALAADGSDRYLLGAYADFLLDRGRPREVIALLADRTRADGLLLRLALAERAADRPEAAAHTEVLAARFSAARRRGDTVHRREEARFWLGLRGDASAALAAAEANWAVQREPWDARVLLAAALAARRPEAARPVLERLASGRLEDQTLRALARQLENLR